MVLSNITNPALVPELYSCQHTRHGVARHVWRVQVASTTSISSLALLVMQLFISESHYIHSSSSSSGNTSSHHAGYLNTPVLWSRYYDTVSSCALPMFLQVIKVLNPISIYSNQFVCTNNVIPIVQSNAYTIKKFLPAIGSNVIYYGDGHRESLKKQPREGYSWGYTPQDAIPCGGSISAPLCYDGYTCRCIVNNVMYYPCSYVDKGITVGHPFIRLVLRIVAVQPSPATAATSTTTNTTTSAGVTAVPSPVPVVESVFSVCMHMCAESVKYVISESVIDGSINEYKQLQSNASTNVHWKQQPPVMLIHNKGYSESGECNQHTVPKGVIRGDTIPVTAIPKVYVAWNSLTVSN